MKNVFLWKTGKKKGKRLPPGNYEVCKVRGREKEKEGGLGERLERERDMPTSSRAAPRTPPGTSWHLLITGDGRGGKTSGKETKIEH